MKKLIFFSILIFTIFSYSQNRVEQVIAELNNNLKLYNANPKLNQVYLNRNEKILDILNYQIPLEDVKVIYEIDDRTYEGIKIVGNISFKCDNNCIKDSENKFNSGVAFAYKSKEGAYKFLDLIYELKRLLHID